MYYALIVTLFNVIVFAVQLNCCDDGPVVELPLNVTFPILTPTAIPLHVKRPALRYAATNASTEP